MDIERLVSDKDLFNEFVYTPPKEAIVELERRRDNKELLDYVQNSLPAGVPKVLKNEKYVFLSRDVVTPNHELGRFLGFAQTMEGFTPVFWEYLQDKFTPNLNLSKYHLGKLAFHFGKGKKGGEKIKSLRVVDFNLYCGKKISEVKTVWGQKLADFHHEFLESTHPEIRSKQVIFFDASDWYLKSGGNVKIYYKHIFTLFLTKAILLENFDLENKRELTFIKEICLPAFISIYRETGKKPLIVDLEPNNIETELFWAFHSHDSMEFVQKKLNMI